MAFAKLTNGIGPQKTNFIRLDDTELNKEKIGRNASKMQKRRQIVSYVVQDECGRPAQICRN
jgi:hypothetical protein